MGLFSPLISLFFSRKSRSNHTNNSSNTSIIRPLDGNQNQYLATADRFQIQQHQLFNNTHTGPLFLYRNRLQPLRLISPVQIEPPAFFFLNQQQPEPQWPLNQQQQQWQEALLNQQQQQQWQEALLNQHQQQQQQQWLEASLVQQRQQQQWLEASFNQQQQQKQWLEASLNQQPSPDSSDAVIPSTSRSLQYQQQQTVDDNVNPVVKSFGKNDDPTLEGVTGQRKRAFQDSDQLFNSIQLEIDKMQKRISDELSCAQVAKKQKTSVVNEQDSCFPTTRGESCNTEDHLKEVEAIISTIVGLEGVKLQIRKWVKGLVIYEKRKTLGIKVGTRKALHMAFLGNPGTGKTMCARILGKILHKLGLLSTDKVTEVQRTDLVAEYLGQTGPKTREMILEAKGGILFVDEAYRLMPSGIKNDLGKEAIEEIMSAMDNEDIVAIFAGYSKDMERVLSLNEGFSRRVSKIFHFDDYSPKDIAMILQSKMNSQYEGSFVHGFKLHPDCTLEAIAHLIKEHTSEELLKTMNGGLVDPLLVNALENLDMRSDVACSDADTLTTVTMEDLEEGLKSLPGLQGKNDDGHYLHMYCC